MSPTIWEYIGFEREFRYMASITAPRRHAPRQDTFQEDRDLSHLAFRRLLEWLDDGVDSHGETYLEMRRRLVSYFDRRNRLSADELADETLNRIGKTLEKDGAIATTPPARYCYVVAKFVLLEDVRREHMYARGHEPRRTGPERLAGRGLTLADSDQGVANRERRLECLDRCLAALNPEQRAFIVEYYRDAGQQKIARRRDMAQRYGITMNALGIRACRIRADLGARVDACCRQ
jgi:DNA-directed RNA polymerase specialized sigma24 family protein